jgi:hypothetical protein
LQVNEGYSRIPQRTATDRALKTTETAQSKPAFAMLAFVSDLITGFLSAG